MKPRELFIVGVRLLGIFWLASCADMLVLYVSRQTGLVTSESTQPNAALFHAVVEFLVGILLLLCGHTIASALPWDFRMTGTCAQCGRDLNPDSRTCPACGTAVKSDDKAKES